jgi:hypothetical protein
MIKHIVMWDLRGDTAEEKASAAARLKLAFESLRGRIPGMLHAEIGVDTSRIAYACDVVLYSEFESQSALDAYAVHPEHLRVKQEVGDLRIARHQVDYSPKRLSSDPAFLAPEEQVVGDSAQLQDAQQ